MDASWANAGVRAYLLEVLADVRGVERSTDRGRKDEIMINP
jgi:hypothetical protein